MRAASDDVDATIFQVQIVRATEAARELADACRVLASMASVRALEAPRNAGRDAAQRAAEALNPTVQALRELDSVTGGLDGVDDWEQVLTIAARAAAASARSLKACADALATIQKLANEHRARKTTEEPFQLSEHAGDAH